MKWLEEASKQNIIKITLSLSLGMELTATGCQSIGKLFCVFIGGKKPAKKLCALIKHLSAALLEMRALLVV